MNMTFARYIWHTHKAYFQFLLMLVLILLPVRLAFKYLTLGSLPSEFVSQALADTCVFAICFMWGYYVAYKAALANATPNLVDRLAFHSSNVADKHPELPVDKVFTLIAAEIQPLARGRYWQLGNHNKPPTDTPTPPRRIISDVFGDEYASSEVDKDA